jgi:predicted alpha/beta-hydrolase family hydrolase
MLFVQGTRDAFGTSAEIAALLPALRHAELHEVAGGDHSFTVTGRKGDVLEGIMDAVAVWIKRGR